MESRCGTTWLDEEKRLFLLPCFPLLCSSPNLWLSGGCWSFLQQMAALVNWTSVACGPCGQHLA